MAFLCRFSIAFPQKGFKSRKLKECVIFISKSPKYLDGSKDNFEKMCTSICPNTHRNLTCSVRTFNIKSYVGLKTYNRSYGRNLSSSVIPITLSL